LHTCTGAPADERERALLHFRLDAASLGPWTREPALGDLTVTLAVRGIGMFQAPS
jgi:hypothetical protein